MLTAAAEHAAEHGGGGMPIQLLPDLPTLIQQLILFGVLAWVLYQFAWKHILKALLEREAKIRDDLQKAESARQSTEAVLARHEAQLNQVKAEAQAILEEGKADALKLKDKILGEARDEAGKVSERARREIELSRDKAVSDLQAHAAALSVAMASRILGREVQPADQERLLQESLSDLKRQALN